jgi:DNA-binding response OmpR family regulator
MRSHRRHRVLLAAGELDLRARFARELQSSGYAVELASDMKRALRLAADDHFRVAIVAPGTGSANLAMMLELRDTVPEMIVLVEGPGEIASLRRSLTGVDEFILKSSNASALTTRVSEIIALTDGAADERVHVPSIVYVEGCKLDLGGCFCHSQRPGDDSHPRRVRLAERIGAQSLPSCIA